MNLDSFRTWNSTGNAVGSTFTSTAGDLGSVDITALPHVFIGVVFTDNDGVAATPGAGTFTVTVETLNNPGVFQSIENGTTIDATAALTTLSVAANITRVRVALTGITTATLFNVNLSANAS